MDQATELANLAKLFFYSHQRDSKFKVTDSLLDLALSPKARLPRDFFSMPVSRTVSVLSPQELPDKPGLASILGQGRLMHDLASIELQACEVMMRTLLDFPDAPPDFREALGSLIREELLHFQLCLEALENCRLTWGSFPVHLGLWGALRNQDSLLDRVLLIHRYLEGSGLDASAQINRRLNGIDSRRIKPAVDIIFRDEINHVLFGSKWYRQLCQLENLDAQKDFPLRMEKLKGQLPRRLEKIDVTLRLKAGFTLEEIEYLQQRRLHLLS